MTWRALPSPDEPGAPVQTSLGKVAARLGLPDPTVLTKVFEAWPSAVGSSIAEHTRPIALREGVLKVVADDSQWLTQLRWSSSQVVKRLNDVCGGEPVEKIDARLE